MVWGNPENAGEYFRATALAPLSLVYGIGNWVHRKLYQFKLRSSKKISAQVISIGNITCGGTGKTPVVISLAKTAVEQGIRTAIISRGYKRKDVDGVVVVSDGKGAFASVEEAGDEPLLIAKSAPILVVISGPDRPLACQKAVAEFGCDFLILDDGFQHYRLERDADIVLIDYNDEPSKDDLLPSGRLREPFGQIKRASHVVITKVPQTPDQAKLDHLKALIKNSAPNVQISTCRMQPSNWRNVSSNGIVPLAEFEGKAVVAFCGIARPETFTKTISELNVNVASGVSYPDHHWYTAEDVAYLGEVLKEHKAEILVTTAKDAVKLRHLEFEKPVFALDIETVWLDPIPSAFTEQSQPFAKLIRKQQLQAAGFST